MATATDNQTARLMLPNAVRTDLKGRGAMTLRFAVRTGLALTSIAALPGAALAQAAWTPASEIVGQPVQVTTNGVTNTVYLDPAGTARS